MVRRQIMMSWALVSTATPNRMVSPIRMARSYTDGVLKDAGGNTQNHGRLRPLAMVLKQFTWV